MNRMNRTRFTPPQRDAAAASPHCADPTMDRTPTRPPLCTPTRASQRTRQAAEGVTLAVCPSGARQSKLNEARELPPRRQACSERPLMLLPSSTGGSARGPAVGRCGALWGAVGRCGARVWGTALGGAVQEMQPTERSRRAALVSVCRRGLPCSTGEREQRPLAMSFLTETAKLSVRAIAAAAAAAAR
eukprot:CAMPEP_0181227404 /NCGR_PEP_ID=MMETSP1096-20121128/32769_1 /TAXON_ID=156174 ORGANISM="Chrysochromulina ericina, Strain CCMP281" /NCGR_SAMPLE_ID=MMETSP1096 /ASSEMBLY_ACC=CAM_ASM_000453 /LENGTH=187 /DNA_ID=CAMNT_0023320805 /DNA_START=69 /DNA_END=630 /DNA_ORIENTATION=+